MVRAGTVTPRGRWRSENLCPNRRHRQDRRTGAGWREDKAWRCG